MDKAIRDLRTTIYASDIRIDPRGSLSFLSLLLLLLVGVGVVVAGHNLHNILIGFSQSFVRSMVMVLLILLCYCWVCYC